MDQLGRGGRGPRCEVVLLDQEHAQAAAGGIAGDTSAVDAAPDDGEVEIAHDSLQATASRGAAMSLKPVSGHSPARPREGGGPSICKSKVWIPAFAGMS